MARFGLKLLTEHLPRVMRRRPMPTITPSPETEEDSKPNYWMQDCALHPWRKGCRTYDV